MSQNCAELSSEEYILRVAAEFGLTDFAKKILYDGRFMEWSGSGSPDKHHYGRGGLLQHTYEVIKLAMGMCDSYDKFIDKRLVFIGALMHDVGKIRCYKCTSKETDSWEGTLHKSRVYHVVESALIWQQIADATLIPHLTEEDYDHITHIILAHHGCKEWGSPVRPQTKEAWIVHLADSASARLNDNLKSQNL